MRETLSVDKVMRLAEAGETFTLEAGDCPMQDLVLIAAVIGQSRARVRFRGLHDRPIEDLMRLTVASQGRVVLEQQPTAAAPPAARVGWLRRRLRRPPAGDVAVGRAA